MKDPLAKRCYIKGMSIALSLSFICFYGLSALYARNDYLSQGRGVQGNSVRQFGSSVQNGQDAQQPEGPLDLLRRADKRYNNARYNDAEQLYNQFLKEYPRFEDRLVSSEVYHKLGLIARKRQQYKKAMDYLVQAIQVAGTQNPQITFDYAHILFDIGEYDRAVSLFARLYEIQPTDRQTMDFYAQALIQKREYDKAYPFLKEVMGDEQACQFIAQKAEEKGDRAVVEEMQQHICQVNMNRDQQFFFDGENGNFSNVNASFSSPVMENASIGQGVGESRFSSYPAQEIAREPIEAFRSSKNSRATQSPVETAEPFLNSNTGRVATVAMAPQVFAETMEPGVSQSREIEKYAVSSSKLPNGASVSDSYLNPQSVCEPLPSETFLPAFSSYLIGQSDSNVLEGQPSEADEWVSTKNFQGGTAVDAELGVSYPGLSMDLHEYSVSYPASDNVEGNSTIMPVAESGEDEIFASIQNVTEQSVPTPNLETISPISRNEHPLAKRKTSEEKLADAIAAGATVEYLTPEVYRHEIATRADTMVREAKEEAARLEAEKKTKKNKFFFK